MKLTRTLLRGLRLLEVLAESGDGLRVTDLSEKADLDKATALRLLATLEHAGYVAQAADTKIYQLTGKIVRMAQEVGHELDLRHVARPHLTALRDSNNESVHLGVRDGEQVVYVDKLESTRSIRLVSAVGQHMPLNTTALGKAILSAMSPEARESVLEKATLASRTEHSITDPAKFKEELELTARRGFAVDHGENEDNVICVGAPVTGPDDEVVAAVSVSGPFFRMKDQIEEVGKECRRTAEAISRQLGATGSGR